MHYICAKEQGGPIREEEKQHPLREKQSLQKALAAFKVQCRRVKNFCLKEGEEHHLATSYCQVNRLRTLGIENRHPAIRGIPVLDDEDRKAITQAILAMRGMNQTKEKGNMKQALRNSRCEKWHVKEMPRHGCGA